MDHEGARRLMAEAMEGRLQADDERELALHLVGCDECKSVYEGLQHANPALTSIQLGEPSTEALDAAVHRATTVLRGEADPGPMGLTEEPPGLPEELDANTVRIDSGTSFVPIDIQPAGPTVSTGPMPQPATSVRPSSPPEAHVRAIEAEDAPILAPELEPEPELPQFVVEPPREVEAPVEVAPVEASAVDAPAAPVPTEAVAVPRSEIDSLLEEDRARFEPLPYEEEPADGDRMGPGPWLVAIAVTILLAVLAGFLITRGQGLFGGGDLPSASEVRSRVGRAFADMKSLKTSFDISKLSLYRISRDADAATYSFTTGRWEGSIDYDRAEGYKQDFTLTVGGDEVQRAEIVQRSDETRSLVGTGDDRNFLVEQNPPLGPPDGALRPTLGLLEESLGTAAELIAGADDLDVVRVEERDGRQTYVVTMTVPANELTRGDRIEAALDANNFLPVVVKRSVSRENASVLASSDLLTDDKLDVAFGDKDRITTEVVELANVQYDEIVLPGDLALDAPDGLEEQTSNANFERLTRAELGAELDYEPLLPRSLPDDYEEQLLARYTGEKRKWGPGGVFPGAESVFQSQYFNGETTIVVTQRRMAARFNFDGSPLQRELPVTTRRVERDEKTFFFGSSPDLPPHVYGFLGNVFVVVSGYASQNELVRVAASLSETPVDLQAPLVSPSPGPTGSPLATASP